VKAVILAAGRGTRMMPLTTTRPKMMIPVINRPILEHIVVGLRDAGIRQFLFVTGHLGDQIADYFGDGSDLGVDIDYRPQDTDTTAKYGTAIAAGLAREFVAEEPFVLTFGDIMTPPENYAALMAAYQVTPGSAFLCVNRVDDVSSGGAVFVQEGRVVDMIEKPPAGTVATQFINSGIFILRPEVFPAIDDLTPSARGEYELTTALVRTIREGIPTHAHELEGYWSNVGDPAEVMWLTRLLLQRLAATRTKLERRLHREDRFRGPVFVGKNVDIHPEAHITGPVVIGDNCEIGNAHVGFYTTLGESCRVADGARVVSSAVLPGTTIGENSQVGHALLGSGVRVRRNARLLGTCDQTTVVGDGGVIAAAS